MHETISLSIRIDEYQVLSKRTKDVVYLTSLFIELKICNENPIQLYCDNMNCIKLTNNLIIYVNTKHIELQYHYICNRIQDGSVEVDFILIHKYKTNSFINSLYIISYKRLYYYILTWLLGEKRKKLF